LSPVEKCVLLLLADYCNPETGFAYPSVPKLAALACVEPRSCNRVLARLRDGGVIEVIPQKDERGLSKPNYYRIPLECEYPDPSVTLSPSDKPAARVSPERGYPDRGVREDPDPAVRGTLTGESAKPQYKPQEKPQGEEALALTSVEVPAISPAFISFPLNDNSEYSIPEHLVDEWARLYPAVDVPQALRSMRGWLLANPRRRKTRTGIKAFAVQWLAKDQNSSRSSEGGHFEGRNRAQQRDNASIDAATRAALNVG
jgi:hypothetical protein